MPPVSEDPAPDDLLIAPGVSVPPRILRFTFARSGGPGGQNVNKLETKAVLHVALADLAQQMPPAAADRLAELPGVTVNADGDVVIAADETRSQRQNRQLCLDKLRELILRALVRPKRRKKTRPSRGSKERRIKSKKRRGDVKRGRQGRFE